MRPQPPPRARPHAAASELPGTLAPVPGWVPGGTLSAPPAASAGADLSRASSGRVCSDSKKFGASGELSPNEWQIEIFRHPTGLTRVLGSFSAQRLNADPPATNRRNLHLRTNHGILRCPVVVCTCQHGTIDASNPNGGRSEPRTQFNNHCEKPGACFRLRTEGGEMDTSINHLSAICGGGGVGGEGPIFNGGASFFGRSVSGEIRTGYLFLLPE